MQAAKSNRFPAVDLIRGLCIINVVIHHTNIRIPFARSAMGSLLPDAAIRFLFWTGDYSVKIFFVISGFLITTSILSRWGSLANIDVGEFYRRRFARIAPCLLALLAILGVLHIAHTPGFTIANGRASLPRALLAALTLHLNWLEAATGYLPGAWDILWSLSVEEAFYLAYPVLCRYASRKVLVGVTGLLMILGPLARTRFAFNEIWADYSWLSGMDAIAMGCAATFVARHWRIAPGARWSLRAAGVTLALCVLFRGVARSIGLLKTGLDVSVLALGIVLLLVTIREDSARGVWKPLAWFGRNSYEVYLTHMFVVTVGTQIYNGLGKPANYAPLWFVVHLALAGILGAWVARWYSIPLNRILTHSVTERVAAPLSV